MFSIKELAAIIEDAEKRIRPHTRITPMIPGSTESNPPFLKLENEQYTGSFKARGSLNKIMCLTASQRKAGVITASTGNHGLGVARALKLTNTTGTIYLPRAAKQAKVERLKEYGVRLEFVNGGPLQAELTAKAHAARSDAVWISPYNDIEVIAGQGTIAIELFDQKPNIERVFITVGGGGLISGIGAYLKNRDPRIEIIGCVPQNSPEMMLSVQAGKIVQLNEEKPTLSDGSAGGVEDGSVTFEYCQHLVDKWVTVTEEEIAQAMQVVYTELGIKSEGSAGVAFAGHQKTGTVTNGDIIIICGGNIEDRDFFDAIG